LLASHLEKFAGFVLDLDGLRRPLQMCAQALAFELPSSTIVYGPDSASPFQEALCVVQGGSLSEILSVVKVKCGVPANSIREMADEDEELRLERRCYYIETVDLEGA
jgi:hypothetical protein